jgi:hypothetical protein
MRRRRAGARAARRHKHLRFNIINKKNGIVVAIYFGRYFSKKSGATLVMPYMVDGCMTVTSGVASRGVLGPNTAIVDGAYTRRLCCAASSSTFCAAQAGRQGQRGERRALRGCVQTWLR